MKNAKCPLCDFASAVEQTYKHVYGDEGKQLTVSNLHQYVCPSCDATFVDDEQSRHNLVQIELAEGTIPSYVLPESIKRWRVRLKLTQREAARLLGGGVNAFSKYENGDITQSESMDNLLWLAESYPGIIAALAMRRKVVLSEEVLSNCGNVTQFFYSSAPERRTVLQNSPRKTGSALYQRRQGWICDVRTVTNTINNTYSGQVGSANDHQYKPTQTEAA